MHAHPSDEENVLGRLALARNNPYAILDQFRVIAIDYEGVEWNCGWVDVSVGENANSTWRLWGIIQGIMTRASGPGVKSDSSVELIFDTRFKLPFPLKTDQSQNGRDGSSRSSLNADHLQQHLVETDDGTVFFDRSLGRQQLWVSAATSSVFSHPFIENWLGEPLNLLLGQLVYPRLVARNKGDGSAFVSLRATPEHTANTQISSLMSQQLRMNPDRFWELYGLILAMIVHANDEVGERTLDPHPLTQYYQEIAQATKGSNWVLCMTLASVIEGVTKLMFPADQRMPNNSDEIDEKEKSIKCLESHLALWKGDEKLRQRLESSLLSAREPGVMQLLKDLRDSGVIDKEHLKVWRAVRNEVMHGNLISPWLTAELEDKLKRLIEMTHRISEAYIRKMRAARR